VTSYGERPLDEKEIEELSFRIRNPVPHRIQAERSCSGAPRRLHGVERPPISGKRS